LLEAEEERAGIFEILASELVSRVSGFSKGGAYG